MATKKEYDEYIRKLKDEKKAHEDALKSNYNLSLSQDRQARNALHQKMDADRHAFHHNRHHLQRQLDSDIRTAKSSFRKNQQLPTSREEVKKENLTEETKGFNSEQNNVSPDMTTYLKSTDIAALRKKNGLPSYTNGEEVFNSVTHIVGGGLGVIGLALGVVFAAIKQPQKPAVAWSMAVFGLAMIMLYTISAVYHGLHVNKGKKVLQILDHCTIYFLIAGTYTPICFISLSTIFPWNFVLLGCIYAMDILGIVLNATMMDKKPVKIISQILYLVTGWTIVFFYPILIQSLGPVGMWLVVGGGISYTVGAVFYAIGHSKKWFHSIFHLFVLFGTLLQFLGILLYGVIGL